MEAVLTFFLVFTVFMISKEEEEEAEHNFDSKKESNNIPNEETPLHQLPHHHTVYHYTVGGGDLLDIKGPLGVISALAACMIFGGPVTRASLNPARSFGPALCSNFWTNQYVYWIGPFAGSILAVLIYKTLTFSPVNKNK